MTSVEFHTAQRALRARNTNRIAVIILRLAVGAVRARALNGAGDTAPAMFINLGTLWGLQIPLAWLLSQVAGWGTTGLWVGVSAANVANGLIFAGWFLRGKWKEREV